MKQLLEKLDVDTRQYRALLKLAWRLDMRETKMGFGWEQSERKPKAVFFTTLIYYFVLGFIFAGVFASSSNTFLGASMLIGALIFLLGSMLLIEFNTIVISPDDYHILGYQPVSSRTYFLAKFTNALAYILTFAVILGGPTAGLLLFKDGFHPGRAAATLIAIFLTALFVVMAVVSLYGWIMQRVAPQRLKNVLSYLQVIVSMLIYTGYFFLDEVLKGLLPTLSVMKSPWLLLLPTSWYAAVIEIGYGHAGMLDWLALACGTGVLALLGRTMFGRLSLDYARRIALYSETQASRFEKEAAVRRRAMPLIAMLRSPEHRVVARLTMAQLRYDTKFRMAFVAVLPLMALYFYMGLRQGQLLDPFVHGGEGAGNYFLFFLVVLMLPIILKNSLEQSDAFAASWIFYSTPCAVDRLVRAARDILYGMLTMPVLLVLLGVFLYYFENPLHAVAHTFTFALASFVVLQILYLLRPRLPFSEPKIRGSQSAVFTILIFALPLAGLLLVVFISRTVYRSTALTLAAYLGMLLLSYVLEKWIKVRIARLSRRLQYSA